MAIKKILHRIAINIFLSMALFCCAQTGEHVVIENHINKRYSHNSKIKESYDYERPNYQHSYEDKKKQIEQDIHNMNKEKQSNQIDFYTEDCLDAKQKDNADKNTLVGSSKNIKEYKKIETIIGKQSQIQKDKITIVLPADGSIVKEFNPNEDSAYEGVTIETEDRSNILSSLDGVVVYVGDDLVGNGEMIIIEHDNDILTTYANLKTSCVVVGQSVAKGETIGQSDITINNIKPRILFFMRINGEPCDPLIYVE